MLKRHPGINPRITEKASAAIAIGMVVVSAPLYSMASSSLLPLWFVTWVCITTIIMFVVIHYWATPVVALMYCLLTYTMQNVYIGVFNTANAVDGIPLLLGYSFLIPAVIAAIALLDPVVSNAWRHHPWLHVVLGAYLGYMVLNLIASPFPWTAKLPAFRNATAFVFLFYPAYLLRMNRLDAATFWTWFMRVTAVIVVFGLAERFILGDLFWVRNANINLVAEVKHLRPTVASRQPVPSDFYSPVSGTYYRRMVSVFGTPITLAYFLAFATIVAPAVIRLRHAAMRWIVAGILFLALILTLSKGGVQLASIGLLVYVVLGSETISNRMRFLLGTRVGLLTSITAAGLLGHVTVLTLDKLVGTSASTHLAGLVGPIFALRTASAGQILFGHLLGSGGTISARLGINIPFDALRGAESGIGSLLYQCGVVGVIGYIIGMVFILNALYHLIAEGCADSERKVARAVYAAVLALVINAFFQENALALIPASPFLIGTGIVLNPQLASFPRTRLEGTS